MGGDGAGWFRRGVLAAGAAAALLLAPGGAAALDDRAAAAASRDLLFTFGEERRAAARALAATGDPRLIPTFALAMRWSGGDRDVAAGLARLAGAPAPIADWRAAYDLQEARADLRPHPSFRALKLKLLGATDPRFLDFLGPPEGPPPAMAIRLEEVVWGGVRFGEIPALTMPKTVSAAEATYLRDDDPVFGAAINGAARAYPLRVLGWHEMANDVIGGVPVALAYCTLCGSGALYETALPGRARALRFETSGLLHRSNKLMVDDQTGTLWSQLSGRPVVGPLTGAAALKSRPLEVARWGDWRARHPRTRVLSIETGHVRDYSSGAAYRAYFASAELMFPSRVGDERGARRKDHVFGLTAPGGARAWPLAAFAAGAGVVNDRVGFTPVVVLGGPGPRSARAYARGETRFVAEIAGPDGGRALLAADGGRWRVGEAALHGPDGRRAPRLAGRAAYWFAWSNRIAAETGAPAALEPAGPWPLR